ncbi:MAG: serine/threonine-protein phosphatase [Candidatus Brocadiales bacterium]|nr:serine/threonine-protein phosphatase [Candidatus Brocadiales bacterium]
MPKTPSFIKASDYFTIETLTHPGAIHKQNQDAILINQRVHQSSGFISTGYLETTSPHLIAISDGVSQSPNPSKASRTVLQGLLQSWESKPDSTPIQHKESIQDYLDKATNKKLSGMSATLVAALYNNQKFTIINSGDSRAYLIDALGITQLSKDHTTLQRMLDDGDITKEEAANASSLYDGLDQCFVARSLDGPPRIHTCTVALKPGQLLLLCSDGLNLYLSDDEIWDRIMNSESIGNGVVQLGEKAIARGGEDNISIICIGYSTEMDLKFVGCNNKPEGH